MKTGKFEYRCKRCGNIEVNPCTSEDNAKILLLCILYKLPKPVHFISDVPKEQSVHVCEDGGVGISELIGYRVEEI